MKPSNGTISPSPANGAAAATRGGSEGAPHRTLLRGVVTAAEPRVLHRLGGGTAAPQSDPPRTPTRAAVPPTARASEREGDAPAARASGPREDAGAAEAARLAQEAAVQSGRERGVELGLEEGRRRGAEEGLAAGREAAEREARSAREALAVRIAAIDRLVEALPRELDRRLASAEDDMVALCHTVVCRILGEQLVTRDGTAQLVRQAVREAGGRGAMAIHLHPSDAAAIEADELLATWMRQHTAGGTVQWVGDDRVALGGCIVRFPEGSLDARLETQLASLREVLLAARAGGGTTASPPEPARASGDATPGAGGRA